MYAEHKTSIAIATYVIPRNPLLATTILAEYHNSLDPPHHMVATAVIM